MVFSLSAPATIERLFRDGEFHDVAVRTYSKPLRLPVARDFLWPFVHCTPLTETLSNLDAARNAAPGAGRRRWVAAVVRRRGMRYEQGMNVAKAHK